LRGGEVDGDDGCNAFRRRVGCRQCCQKILPEFFQQMAHGGEDQLFLAAEIMVRQRWRNTRFVGDLRDSHVKRTALADGADGRINQLPLAQWFHSDFGHAEKPRSEKLLFLIDWPINKNCDVLERYLTGGALDWRTRTAFSVIVSPRV
jgi:hypothetical protein